MPICKVWPIYIQLLPFQIGNMVSSSKDNIQRAQLKQPHQIKTIIPLLNWKPEYDGDNEHGKNMTKNGFFGIFGVTLRLPTVGATLWVSMKYSGQDKVLQGLW